MKNKIILLIFVTFFIYFNSIFNPFIFDDFALIVDNPYIRSFKNFKFYFTTDLFRGNTSNFYRPLQTIFYATIYKLFKLNPVPYHLLNIFLHTGCSILFFLSLKEIYGEKISFLSSLLWAIHPINTEGITYISGTADPLFLFFGLFAIYLYNKNKKILSWLLFILSLLSKEMAIVIPLYLLLYLWTKNEKIEKNITLFFILSVFYGVLRLTILKFMEEPKVIFSERFFTAFKSFLYYVYLLIFPFILSMARAYPYIKSPNNLWFISGFILFCISIYMVFKNRKNKKIIFPYLFYLINFFSISGIFTYINATISEHFIYMGCLGFFIYFILLFERIKREKLKLILIIIIFSLYGIRTILRNYDWKEPIKFYEKSIKYGFKHKKIYYNLAFTYYQKGNYQKALENFKIAENLYKNKKLVYQGIASCYYALGNYKEAENYYKKILDTEPDDPVSLTSLATIYYNRKEKPIYEVIGILKNCIYKNPAYRNAYVLLGRIFFENGNYKESIKYLKIAVLMKPEDEISQFLLGISYFNTGNKDMAEKHLINLYNLNPKKYENILNLAIFYKMVGKIDKAIKFYNEVIKIRPDDIDSQNDLALCYALKGEKEKAKRIWEEIIKKYPNYKPAKENLKMINLKN